MLFFFYSLSLQGVYILVDVLFEIILYLFLVF